MSCTVITNLAFLLLEFSIFVLFLELISSPLCNSNTHRNSLMVFLRNIKQDKTARLIRIYPVCKSLLLSPVAVKELISPLKVYNHLIFIFGAVIFFQMDYGVGHWILYPDSHADRFLGEAFGIMWKLWDLADVKFHMQSTPHTVEVPGFEPKGPPIFTKIRGQSGTSIIG